MAIYLTELDKNTVDFPPTESAMVEPNGLLAFGGDLSPKRILNAYKNGIFPWYGPGEPILWWSPFPRAVFDPNTYTPSKSLKKVPAQAQLSSQYQYSNETSNSLLF